ncbi:MAG: SMP-30/gluconolactonase/LRE family protein [Rubrivivax sp.]|nr:MAG: SMP-30/gluconolactonase/LRE family protein [Rubrivivax sp.]
MKSIKSGLILGSVALIAYLSLWPVEIDPVGWTPPKLPQNPNPNSALKHIERLALNLGVGPEGISFDKEGRIYAGYKDGRIVRFGPDGKDAEVLANTGGRPWGTHASSDGRSVLVADAVKGLLRVANGQVEVLATQADGLPFKLTDDVDQASDGMIYFTDASSKFGIEQMMADVMENGSHGRLMSYDPRSKKVHTLMAGLHVANGVTVGPDDAFLLVAETLQYRVMRYWLKGPKAGTSEVFVENLPGFPDNISYNGRDGFWLALFAPRDPVLDAALPYPAVLKVFHRVPEALRPKPAQHGRVLKLDLDGRVRADLQDADDGAYAPITSVREVGKWLYFGSIEYPAMGRLPLPMSGATQP